MKLKAAFLVLLFMHTDEQKHQVSHVYPMRGITMVASRYVAYLLSAMFVHG